MLRERGTVSGSTPRSRVAISFGSPAGESGVTRLDLNEILIRNPQAAFLVRIAGSAMREAGIDDGDLAVVDRAHDAGRGHQERGRAGSVHCRRSRQRPDCFMHVQRRSPSN
jgi:hypothetical protein